MAGQALKYGVYRYIILVILAFGLVTGAVAMPIDANDADGAPLSFPVDESEHVCDAAAPIHDIEKLDKQYDKWGVVMRPGVVMPITTLFNAHTKEALPIFENPPVKPDLLRHFFRCRGFGDTVDMAPELIETIVAAARHFESTHVTMISGYRSPKFNDALAKKGRRVAAESRHMKGQAVDFRLDTVTAEDLGPWLRAHFEGGVGTYRADNFVHIDVGPKRSWQGH
ncbi:MAG: YcbK family protein [Deltaproteobacteria bacterium]|nr:YcbK family protein [Deltaproteobacteria bacterium]